MSNRMLRFLILTFFAGFCLIQHVQAQDKDLDVIILKNGTVLEGEILEGGEEGQITIISLDGNSYTLRIIDIAEIKRGEFSEKEIDSERRAVGSYILVLGVVATVLGTIFISIPEIGASSGPVLLVLGGITGIVGGLYYIYSAEKDIDTGLESSSKNHNEDNHSSSGITILEW